MILLAHPQNSTVGALDFSEWIINVISHFIMHVIFIHAGDKINPEIAQMGGPHVIE